MEFKLFIALFLATVLAFSAATDDDSNGSDSGSGSMGSWGDSFEERDDDCDRLVEGSDDNDGKCDLTDGLEEIPDKCDKCSSDDKTKIIEWISKLKIELKVKVSVEERLEIASASMLEFQMENPSVFGLIQFQNVSSWGWLVSFTKHIEIRQTKKVESLITLDDDDNCPLFDALFNCTDGSYEQESAVNALINETLLEICGDMTLSVTKKNKKIFEALSKFFSLHAEWQVSFFKYKIKGFGSFHQFFEITKTSYQITEVDVILEGEVEECAFMVSFKNQLELIKADATVSLTIKASLNQFYQRVLQALKAGGLKGKARLSIIIHQFNECFKLYDFLVEFLMTIEIEGFGSFLELIFCGPGKLPHPPKPTLGPIVSSPKPTCSCTCGSTSFPALT